MLNRLSSLIRQHAEIEAKIGAERGRPAPDPFELMQLKRRKLILRDRMAEIRRNLPDDGARRA